MVEPGRKTLFYILRLRLLGTGETKTKIKTISNPLSDKREGKTSNS